MMTSRATSCPCWTYVAPSNDSSPSASRLAFCAPPLATSPRPSSRYAPKSVVGQLPGDLRQRLGVDDGGLELGQFALGAIRVLGEDLGGDDQPEHGVAEELEPLVGGQATVLVGVAAVCQRDGQQFVGQVDAERLRAAASGRPSPRTSGGLRRLLAVRFGGQHRGQLRPARVDHVVLMIGGSASASAHAALAAQPGAVLSAHRRERQHQADGVDDRLFEVDGVVDDVADLVVFGGGLGGAVRIGEQLGEVDRRRPR